jgi:uncharacterized membrane protein
MEQALTFLQDNPVYMIGAIILLVIIAIGLFKKTFKIVLIGLLLFGLYSWYINDQTNAEDIAKDVKNSLKKAGSGLKDAQDAGEKWLDKIN